MENREKEKFWEKQVAANLKHLRQHNALIKSQVDRKLEYYKNLDLECAISYCLNFGFAGFFINVESPRFTDKVLHTTKDTRINSDATRQYWAIAKDYVKIWFNKNLETDKGDDAHKPYASFTPNLWHFYIPYDQITSNEEEFIFQDQNGVGNSLLMSMNLGELWAKTFHLIRDTISSCCKWDAKIIAFSVVEYFFGVDFKTANGSVLDDMEEYDPLKYYNFLAPLPKKQSKEQPFRMLLKYDEFGNLV